MRPQGLRRFSRAGGINDGEIELSRLTVSMNGKSIEGPAELCGVYSVLHDRNGFLSEAEAAAFMNPRCSTRQFRRIFKDLTGETFRVVQLRVKVSRAATLLEFTELSIPHIAEFLKYSARAELAKSFKDVYRITPTQYRKRFRPPDNKMATRTIYATSNAAV